MAVYFSIFLVILTCVTGVVWLADKFYLAPQRRLKLSHARSQCSGELSAEDEATLIEPSVAVDTAIQIFPVIAFVTILRSFIYEPFQIPSDSMMPTLLDGDFILVNKFNYGLRDPVARHKFFENGLPKRGDVVVFKYPINPQLDYIKRLIGEPGDRIIYRNKTLYIQPACKETDKECPKLEKIATNFVNKGQYLSDYGKPMYRYTSDMGTKKHDILIDKSKSFNDQKMQYCHPHHTEGNICKQAGTADDEFIVPKGHYFVMGDNRDNSLDARFWGFVPEENIVGEAVAIWMSFDFNRTSDDLLPTWVPTNVRFSRIGGIH